MRFWSGLRRAAAFLGFPPGRSAVAGPAPRPVLPAREVRRPPPESGPVLPSTPWPPSPGAFSGQPKTLLVLPPPGARPTLRNGARRPWLLLGWLALAVGLIGGGWLWRASRRAATPPVIVVDTVHLEPNGGGALAPPPPDAQADSVPPPPARGTGAGAGRLADLATAESLRGVQQRIENLRERRFRDSLAKAQALEARRVRDSLALVARDEQEARQQDDARRFLDARARAEQRERERREAAARVEQEAAAQAAALAEQAREARLAAGRTALDDWLSRLVRDVNAGHTATPVVVAGPPGFAGFVGKNHPKLSDARLLTSTVTEETVEATAEWVAKWRTAFGTATTRRMQASVTMEPDGDAWRLQSWGLTEGAP
jgi:hypothetical protein